MIEVRVSSSNRSATGTMACCSMFMFLPDKSCCDHNDINLFQNHGKRAVHISCMFSPMTIVAKCLKSRVWMCILYKIYMWVTMLIISQRSADPNPGSSCLSNRSLLPAQPSWPVYMIHAWTTRGSNHLPRVVRTLSMNSTVGVVHPRASGLLLGLELLVLAQAGLFFFQDDSDACSCQY